MKFLDYLHFAYTGIGSEEVIIELVKAKMI